MHAHRTGAKQLHHPAVGDLDLTYEATEPAADPEQVAVLDRMAPAEGGHHTDAQMQMIER